jgi:hypothetical protein
VALTLTQPPAVGTSRARRAWSRRCAAWVRVPRHGWLARGLCNTTKRSGGRRVLVAVRCQAEASATAPCRRVHTSRRQVQCTAHHRALTIAARLPRRNRVRRAEEFSSAAIASPLLHHLGKWGRYTEEEAAADSKGVESSSGSDSSKWKRGAATNTSSSSSNSAFDNGTKSGHMTSLVILPVCASRGASTEKVPRAARFSVANAML